MFRKLIGLLFKPRRSLEQLENEMRELRVFIQDCKDNDVPLLAAFYEELYEKIAEQARPGKVDAMPGHLPPVRSRPER